MTMRARREIIEGERIHDLVVLYEVDFGEGQTRYACRCVAIGPDGKPCGGRRICTGSKLRAGQVKNCGCSKRPIECAELTHLRQREGLR